MSESQTSTTASGSNVRVVTDGKLELLKEIARDRWDDEWKITMEYYADSTVRGFVSHSVGRVPADEHEFDADADVIESERIWAHGDELYWQRVHRRKEDCTILEDDVIELEG